LPHAHAWQASHNPEEDNGVKLVDPSGGMLEARAQQGHSRARATHAASFG
jgi:phosphomannomutase